MSVLPSSAGHAVTSSLGVSSSQNQIVRRTLCVNITGSLTNFALAGPQAAMWKPVSGKESELFYPNLSSEMDPADAVNSIRAGVVRAVNIKEHMSTFPVTLGVSVSCVPPSEVTDLGQAYAYTVLPHSRISSSQQVYVCSPASDGGSAWQKDYGEWNSSNLEEHGVMGANGHPFVLISVRHPVVGLLRYNQEIIGTDVDKLPKIEGEFIKISRQVLNECCRNLRASVLSKLQTQDMNMFSIQLHRVGAEAWDTLVGAEAEAGFVTKGKWTPEEHAMNKEHHLTEFVTKPYQYVARLEVEYEIPAAPGAA